MIQGLSLDVMYTPGHTDDSYSYLRAIACLPAIRC